MYIFLVVLIALIALLLALAVLVQSGKGGGLAGIASGGQTTQILGARQAPDFLEKATWTLATLFIVLCIVANFFAAPSGVQESIIQGTPATEAPADPILPGTVTDEPPPATPPAPVESGTGDDVQP